MAAIKAPEIAVACVHQLGAHVRVLLTTGGMNFWNKAQTYNPIAWQQMQELSSSSSYSNNNNNNNNGKPLESGKEDDEPALQIHCTLIRIVA